MTVRYVVLLVLLGLISIEDLKWRRISNRKILFGILWLMLSGGIVGIRVMGTVLVTLGIRSLSAFYRKLRKRTGFGGGDSKLLAMVQLYLGFTGTMTALLISGVLLVILVVITRKQEHPLGPLISLGAAIVILGGCIL